MNHNMWLMARKGDVRTLTYLISQGQSVNAKNSVRLVTRITIACGHDTVAPLPSAARSCAAVDAPPPQMCEAPLHIAVAEEQEPAARVLVDNGAVVNVRNGLVRRLSRRRAYWRRGVSAPLVPHPTPHPTPHPHACTP